MGVVAIEHAPQCSLDRFADWLKDAEVTVVRPYAGDDVPVAAAVHGLVVLGGPMSADEDDINPWLPAVRRLLADTVAAEVPTLGICLGAQLLALACGGRVEKWAQPGREAGVVDVRFQPAARDDPLLAGLPNPYPAPSMHRDAVSRLPDDATWLASSTMYPYQAFRVGRAAWGLQFHPEVSRDGIRTWADQYADVDTARVVREYESRRSDIDDAGRALAANFATLCR